MKITEGVYQVSGLIYGMNSNIFALDAGENLILIDSGFSDKQYLDLQPVFKEWKLETKPIKAVLLTHAHFDHAGNAWKFQERGAVVFAGAQDADAIENGGEKVLETLFGKVYHPCSAIQRVSDGEVLQFGNIKITVMALSGHTAGTVGYLVEMVGKRIFFAGDMFLIDTATPHDEVIVKLGWNGSPDYNSQENRKSFEKLRDFDVDIIAPGHGGVYCGESRHIFQQLYELAVKEEKMLKGQADEKMPEKK